MNEAEATFMLAWFMRARKFTPSDVPATAVRLSDGEAIEVETPWGRQRALPGNWLVLRDGQPRFYVYTDEEFRRAFVVEEAGML